MYYKGTYVVVINAYCQFLHASGHTIRYGSEATTRLFQLALTLHTIKINEIWLILDTI